MYDGMVQVCKGGRQDKGEMVGATGFEPATTWSQTRSATGLRYTPKSGRSGDKTSRGDMIRTCDHLVPNQERYRAALHPASLPRQIANAKVSLFTEITKCFVYYF